MNSVSDLQVGFVPLARTTFDIPLARQCMARARTALSQLGLAVVGPESLVTDLEEAASIAMELAEQPLDLLVVLQATFADSTMVVRLAELVSAPLFLWAVPEEHSGGRLRLNAHRNQHLDQPDS